MKRKILLILLSIISVVCLAFGLSACNSGSSSENGTGLNSSSQVADNNQSTEQDSSDETDTDSWSNGVYTVSTAYAMAQSLGYNGSLEDFISSITGSDGKDGTNGIGISNIVINANGELVITLTNDSSFNLGVVTGVNGNDGEDGSVWYTGSGAPTATTGKNGDMYLDTSSYDIYQMTDGTWVKTCNIKGADGDDGADGSVWYTGSGTPSATTGKNGDMYLDTSSYDIYKMTEGSWTKTGNIKGADGNNSEDGTESEDGSSTTPTETAETVTVTFDSDGGTACEAITVTKGNSIENLPEPEKEGYVFTGWYSGTGVNNGQVTDVTPISRDMTLYAIWEKVYNMTVYSIDSTPYIEDYCVLYGYYEGSFETNFMDITITYNNTEYTINDAISEGYVNEYYIKMYSGAMGIAIGSTEYLYNFYCEIDFARLGEYTVTLSYGYSSASCTIEVIHYYMYANENEIATGDGTYIRLYYCGDHVNEKPTITITGGENYSATYTLNLYQTADYGDDTVWFYEFNCTLCEIEDDMYEGNVCGWLYFYKAGEYTVTISYGEDSYSVDITVKNLYYSIEQTEIYTHETSGVMLWYYGDSESFTVNIKDEDSYDCTYTIPSTSGYSSYYYADTETDYTTCISVDCYSSGDIWADIYFNAAGTYTVTIDFNDAAVSYTVEVTDYVFEGEIEIEDIYWDASGYIENNSEISEYSDDINCLGIDLYAPEDYSVTIAVNGTEISSPEDYISSDWYLGELYIEFYPLDIVSYTAGTYTIAITVSSEDNGSATVTLTYVLAYAPAYVDYIYSSFTSWYSYNYDEDECTNVTEYLSVIKDDNTEIEIYAINAEITVTLDETELTAGTVNYTYDENGDIYDLTISGKYDYYVLYESGYNYIVISNSILTAGTQSTLVITAKGTNGEVTATLYLTAVTWYSDIESFIIVNENYDFAVVYYGNESGAPTVTISDGSNTHNVTWEENCSATAEITDILSYEISYSEGYIHISSFIACAEGSYTITVTYGSDSETFSLNASYFDLYVEDTEIYANNSIYFDLIYCGENAEKMTVVIADSTESYTATWDVGSGNRSSGTDNTTSVYIYYDSSYNCANGSIWFYSEGTYTVKITIGENSTSFTVTVLSDNDSYQSE